MEGPTAPTSGNDIAGSIWRSSTVSTKLTKIAAEHYRTDGVALVEQILRYLGHGRFPDHGTLKDASANEIIERILQARHTFKVLIQSGYPHQTLLFALDELIEKVADLTRELVFKRFLDRRIGETEALGY